MSVKGTASCRRLCSFFDSVGNVISLTDDGGLLVFFLLPERFPFIHPDRTPVLNL